MTIIILLLKRYFDRKIFKHKLMKLIVNEKEREENRTLEDECPIVDVFLFLFSVRVCIIALIHIASFLSLTHSVFFRSTTFHLFIDVSFFLSFSLSLSLSIFYCMKKSRPRLHAKKR